VRWKVKPSPQNGDKRIVAKFLWFPKCINGEYRFLEWVIFEQVYDCNYGNFDDWTQWSDVRWLR
jgi:hypothetical protein